MIRAFFHKKSNPEEKVFATASFQTACFPLGSGADALCDILWGRGSDYEGSIEIEGEEAVGGLPSLCLMFGDYLEDASILSSIDEKLNENVPFLFLDLSACSAERQQELALTIYKRFGSELLLIYAPVYSENLDGLTIREEFPLPIHKSETDEVELERKAFVSFIDDLAGFKKPEPGDIAPLPKKESGVAKAKIRKRPKIDAATLRREEAARELFKKEFKEEAPNIGFIAVFLILSGVTASINFSNGATNSDSFYTICLLMGYAFAVLAVVPFYFVVKDVAKSEARPNHSFLITAFASVAMALIGFTTMTILAKALNWDQGSFGFYASYFVSLGLDAVLIGLYIWNPPFFGEKKK